MEKILEVMATSNVCPTEEAVQALLEYLVDPMLPAKSSMRETPSPSQQQSVARQVHAVVLLYNYYHRKKHTQLEYLGFDAFCKLAVILKPSLLAHMKFMQGSDDTELDDLDKQLSLTEKAIIGACDIASNLDPSKDVPTIEWPIHKVTVFLVDYKKENCLLLFSSITEGIWSVIEKDLDVVDPCPEVTEAEKHVNKKKRIIKKPLKKLSNVDDGTAQQIAYSAVKEVTGFNQTDLVILERHVVYSLSKEKSAALFYITQCTQKTSEGIFQVSIKDAINSLKGPLIKKLGSKWTVTEVVEFFHVLPHAQKLLDWFQRNGSSVSLQVEAVGEVDVTPSNSGYCQKGEITKSSNEVCLNGSMVEGHPPETSNINLELQKLKHNDESSAIHSCEFFDRVRGTNVDDASNVLFDAGGKGTSTSNAFQVDNQLNITNPILKGDSAGSASGLKDEMVTRKGGDDEFTAGKICEDISADQNGIHDGACVTYQLNSKYFDKLRMTIASKENILSQTALRALTRKRDKLSLQQRLIQDEIAQCNKNIQIISNGGEDDLAIKIDSIIECCNDVCLTAEERNNEYAEAQRFSHLRRNRVSEATLIMQNPCQASCPFKDLDSICNENNWILPTYHVTATDGGFQANVMIKGVDFEFLGRGDLHASPGKARESAAKKILNQLRSLNSPA